MSFTPTHGGGGCCVKCPAPRLWGEAGGQARARGPQHWTDRTTSQRSHPFWFQLPHSHARQRPLVLWMKKALCLPGDRPVRMGVRRCALPARDPAPGQLPRHPDSCLHLHSQPSQSHKALAPGRPSPPLRHHTPGLDFEGVFLTARRSPPHSTQCLLSAPCLFPEHALPPHRRQLVHCSYSMSLLVALTSLYPQRLKQLEVHETLSSTMKEPRNQPPSIPCPGAPSTFTWPPGCL